MTEIPEPIRRAIEAQERATRGRVSLQAVASALAEGEGIPTDEEAQAQQAGAVSGPSDHTAASGLGDDAPEAAAPVEQPGLWSDDPAPISYETLLPTADVQTYKRVKAATMRIGDEARAIAAALVHGTDGDGSRSGKQFIQTTRGKYRLATSMQSDNSTETAAHERMGVETIHLSEPAEMIQWFASHGIDGRLAYEKLVRDLRARFRT